MNKNFKVPKFEKINSEYKNTNVGNEEIINMIVQKYDVKKEAVYNFAKKFLVFYDVVRKQHLAHLSRTFELLLDNIKKTDKGNSEPARYKVIFEIDENHDKEVAPYSLSWDRAKQQKFNRWVIYLPNNITDTKQLRTITAHELGELFVEEIYQGMKDETRETKHLWATIFGILAICEKNDFYHNKVNDIRHVEPGEVVDDFKAFIQ